MILVTGPNGNVGTELVRMLAERAQPWRVAEHTPGRIAERFGTQVPTVRFSFNDRATWGLALEGVTRLFLLFPLPHPRTARTWMVPFVEAAAGAGVEHIVYVSVPNAGTARLVPHYRVERAIEASGAGWTFLRASYFAQNLVRDITTHAVDIARDGEILIPAGRGRTSFVDSRDVAEVAVDALDQPEAHRNRAYVLTGPQALDLHEVARLMTAELARPIRYREPSFLRFWRTVGPRVTWDTLLFMTGVYWLTRRGSNAPLTDTLGERLGRPPRTMRDFIRDHADRLTGEAAQTVVKVKTPGARL